VATGDIVPLVGARHRERLAGGTGRPRRRAHGRRRRGDRARDAAPGGVRRPLRIRDRGRSSTASAATS